MRLFDFKTMPGQSAPGIWMELHGREVLIYPLELYAVLWENVKEKAPFGRDVKASIWLSRDEILCIYFDYDFGHYIEKYDTSPYIESAIAALKELSQHMINGGKCLYEGFVTETAEQLLIGLDSLPTITERCPLSREDISTEPFSFHFEEPYSCDTPYVIRIGKREYRSYLSDWSTNYDVIRSQMETYCIKWLEVSEIELFYEDSPSTIVDSCRDVRLHRKGERISWIAIHPDEFIQLPTLYGWCLKRQLMRSLYLGLLGLFVTETDDSYCEMEEWPALRLDSYNRLQSCIVEDYINGVDLSDQPVRPRNRVQHTVEEMCEDYDQLCRTLTSD